MFNFIDNSIDFINLIYLQSIEMSDALYTTNWVDMNVRTRKKLVYLLLRSQKPLQFKADPFYTLNYESFLSVSVLM